jgi:hypothetical protein
VTLDEAVAELGLSPPIGADEIRAAYVRLLRTRRPDRDPAGFMRLREAYDLLRGAAAERIEAQPLEVAPSPAPADLPDPEVEPRAPSVGDQLRAFSERLAAVDEDVAAQEAIVREALAAFPRHPMPRWWLIRWYGLRDDPDGAREALGEAARVVGLPFLHDWLWSYPEDADAGQIQQALASENPSLAALGAYAAARRGDFTVAASALEALFASGRTVSLEPALATITALLLGPADVRQRASGLEWTALRYIAALPPDERPEASVAWRAAVITELAHLPAEFPDAWREGLVRAALAAPDGEPIASPATAVTAAESHLWRERLGSDFPFVSAVLQLPEPSRDLPRRTGRSLLSWLQIVFVAGAVVTTIVASIILRRPDASPPAAPPAPPAVIVAAARDVCAKPVGATEADCELAWALVEEMAFSDCSRARLALMDTGVRSGPSSLVQAGEAALEEICKR